MPAIWGKKQGRDSTLTVPSRNESEPLTLPSPPAGRACLPCTILGSGPAGRQGRERMSLDG